MRRFEPVQAATLDEFCDKLCERYKQGYHLVDLTFQPLPAGGFVALVEDYQMGVEELPHKFMAEEIGAVQR